MAGRVDDYERTMAFADIAFGQMKALRQPPSPRNFEIWYAYASGYHPALNQQINATLKAKGTISEADLVHMYEKFLSPTRLTERIDLVGSQVKGRDRSSHGNDRRRRRFGQQLH
jgi:diguanylate cyclase